MPALSFLPSRVFGCVATTLFGVLSAAAQQVAAPPADGGPVVLSPFVLSEGKDTGYKSTNSLAGSRLNTDYRDIASHLEVMTPDFLSDIGAFTIEEAFNYSGNTESPSETWGVGAGTGDGFLGTATASMSPSRTRGLSRTTPTRNYFPTFIAYDSYNSFERGLTIASGPNPGLFGLGSPSGIANTDYNRASVRERKGALRWATDSHGSRRADVDYNLPLRPGQLALRLDGLLSEKKYPFKGNYADDKRLTAAVGWAPRKALTVDLYGEHVDRRTSVPFYSLPTDAVTPWVNPGVGNRTPFATPDVSPDAATRGNIAGNNAYLNNWAGGASESPTYTFGGNGPAGLYSYRYSAVVSTLGRYANQVLGLAPAIGTPTLQDDRLYPFKKYGLFGATRPSVFHGTSVTAVGNARLAQDLHLELAANYQEMLEKNGTLFSPSDIALYIDPNLYGYQAGYVPLDPITANATQAANRSANQSRRVANPNFGALYLDGSESAIIKDASSKQARLSLAYDLSPAQRFASLAFLRPLMSRQRFLGTVSFSDSAQISQRSARLILDDVNPVTGALTAPEVITAANAKAGQSRYLVAANRVFRTRQYLDPNQPHLATGALPFDAFGTWTFPDTSGKSFNVGLLPTSAGNGSRSLNESAAFVYQGNFLRDRVVLIYSRSSDQVSTKALDLATNVASAATGVAPDYRTVAWGRFAAAPRFVNTSKAVVWHAKEWLSLHYNVSGNVDPTPPASHNIDGSLNSFSSGDNREYGVKLGYKGVGLTINQFKTWQKNLDVPNTFGQTGFLLPTDRLEARYIGLQRARAQALGLADFTDYYRKSATAPGYNPLDNLAGSGYYRLYGDNFAKGIEVELSGRLGKFDLRATAAKTNSVKSNIGPGWQQYATDPLVFKRMEEVGWYAFDATSGRYRPVVGVAAGNVPVFGAAGATPLKGWANVPMADTGASVSMYNQYSQNVLPGALLVQKLSGTANPLLREWRYNGTVAYGFGRHWRAGVSVRQRGKSLVGYLTDSATVTIAGNAVTTLVSQIDSPVYSPEQWYFDPFVSFRGKLRDGRDFSVQVNVTNALNNDKMDIIAVSASTANRVNVGDTRFRYYGWTDPLALPVTVRVQDPIAIQLTVKVNF